MGDGTRENPYTREDVTRLIFEHGETAVGLDLSEKVFEQGINLKHMNLKGIILNKAFFPTTFQQDDFRAIMRPAEFHGANLMQAKMQKAELALAQMSSTNLMSADLQGAHLLNANLQWANLRGAELLGASLTNAQLQGADLYNAKLQGAFLDRTRFSEETRLEDADWGSYILGEENNGRFKDAESAYRQLKVWYKQSGHDDMAGEFYYREMESKRKLLQQPILKYLKQWKLREFIKYIFKGKSFSSWIRLWIYGLICGYGERPWQVFCTAVIVILGLGLIYQNFGTLNPNSLWDGFYYSAVSFVALGYGSWAPEPIGWVKYMGAVEAVIGVFMIALFLVTFTRKMTR